MRFQLIQAVAGLALVSQVGAHVMLSVTVKTEEDQKPTTSQLEAASGILAQWKDPSIMECCPANSEGNCRDGTVGTPYCGYGKCNVFGCNCDGGCRASSETVAASTHDCSRKTSGIDVLNDPTLMECCPSNEYNLCRDGTRGTPYCGYGKCNVFGCACDGGCRKPSFDSELYTDDVVILTASEAYGENMHEMMRTDL